MNATPNGARRARILGTLLLAVVFVGGAFSGAAIDRYMVGGSAEKSARAEPCRGDDRGGDRGALIDQIDLTPEQRARVEQVLERRRVQLDSFWVEARPQLRAIIDATHEEIRAIMTPEQRAEYDRLRAERNARERERERDEQDRPDRNRSDR